MHYKDQLHINKQPKNEAHSKIKVSNTRGLAPCNIKLPIQNTNYKHQK